MDFMYVVVVTGCEAFRLKIAEVETPFRGNLMETVMEALRAKNPGGTSRRLFFRGLADGRYGASSRGNGIVFRGTKSNRSHSRG